MRVISPNFLDLSVAICGTTALVSACSLPDTGRRGYTAAVVHGIVSDGAGTPIPNATVAVNSYFVPCPANAAGHDFSTVTDANGEYRTVVEPPTSPGMRCIAVTVSSTGASQKTVAGAQVRFKPVGDTPHESVRVDVTLP
jgi:hypothetical protein